MRFLGSATLAAAMLAAAALAACSSSDSSAPLDPASVSTAPPTATAGEAASSGPTTTPPAPLGSTAAPSAASSAGTRSVVGTVVRFTSPRTSVKVTIGQDSPATRDFLSMLPLTLPVQEFAGREKISYLPRDLEYAGTPGSDPEDGDLIYFTPWGNLGFYYDTSGIGYADNTLHLGTYEATAGQLALLEADSVSIEVVA